MQFTSPLTILPWNENKAMVIRGEQFISIDAYSYESSRVNTEAATRLLDVMCINPRD
jgi:hypothetical protein